MFLLNKHNSDVFGRRSSDKQFNLLWKYKRKDIKDDAEVEEMFFATTDKNHTGLTGL